MPGPPIICTSDREGNIDECLVEGKSPEEGQFAGWIIRDDQERRPSAPEPDETCRATSGIASPPRPPRAGSLSPNQ